MIVFIGPPCCGKGTQAGLFDRLGFMTFSFGKFLRERSEIDDEFGNKVKRILNQGEFVKAEDIFQNLDPILFQNKKLILDGFPRTLEQAVLFNEFLMKNSLSINCIIEFSISYMLAESRMKQRLICSSCGKNIKINQTCSCGSVVFKKRSDDDIEILKKRFDAYFNERDAIRLFYDNKVKYIKIDAEDDSELVFRKISALIVA